MKIIFKDKPDEIVEVTEPSQLANTKFYCRDKSELDFIESLGFRKYQGEDPRYKDDFGVTVSLWDDMEYSRSIGFDDTGKPFREFEFLPSLSSPSELQDSKQDDSNGWISTAERLPKYKRRVLLLRGRQYVVGSLDFRDGRDFWKTDQADIIMAAIKFWQPLPEPPKPSSSLNPS